jgi:hypothetical protein
MLPKIEKVIAVQNYGTSGTTLIHGLVDNHPQVISLPMLQALPLYCAWEEISAGDVSFELIKSYLTKNFSALFNADYADDESLRKLGEDKNERVEVDQEEFFDHLKTFLGSDINRKNFLVSVFCAYNACYKNRFDDGAAICFPIHSQVKKYAQYLREDFKEVYILHMIREPVQNMGSLIKHISYHQMKPSIFKSLLGCVVQQIFREKMCHWNSGSVELHGKKAYFEDEISSGRQVSSRAMRLEDLHSNSRVMLERFCNWCGISWNNCLLETTFMGKVWHNRAESVRVSGLNSVVTGQKHDQYLSGFDKERLRLLAKTELEYFDYAKFSKRDRFKYMLLPLMNLFPFKSDFNLRRLGYRMNILRGFYSKKGESFLFETLRISSKKNWYRFRKVLCGRFYSIVEWLLLNRVVNTNPMASLVVIPKEKIGILKQILLFMTTLPFFCARVIFNYFSLRYFMILIWCRGFMANRSSGFVKQL